MQDNKKRVVRISLGQAKPEGKLPPSAMRPAAAGQIHSFFMSIPSLCIS